MYVCVSVALTVAQAVKWAGGWSTRECDAVLQRQQYYYTAAASPGKEKRHMFVCANPFRLFREKDLFFTEPRVFFWT